MGVSGIADHPRVHVIDCDSRRRADISRELIARGRHAEIFENTEEFLRTLPADGCILLMQDAAVEGLADFVAAIGRSGRYYPVSVYSDAPQPQKVVRALRQGAIDYLVWPFEAGVLAESLDHLEEEGRRRRGIEAVRAKARKAVERLTERERAVLVSLLDGNSSKQIAAELDLSPRTVEIYRKNLMLKLDARSTSEAVRIGIYADLWELPIA